KSARTWCARRRWMREQGMFDPARLVFVDETAANTKMVRLSGRCPRGERLIGRVPQGHWKTITFVAALRRNGMRAPCTVDGSMNGAKFLAYVEQCLAPTLKRKDIVMIDAQSCCIAFIEFRTTNTREKVSRAPCFVKFLWRNRAVSGSRFV